MTLASIKLATEFLTSSMNAKPHPVKFSLKGFNKRVCVCVFGFYFFFSWI